MKKIAGIVLLVLVSLGCKKVPEACMELSANSVSTGTPLEFSSCSKKALSFEWFMSGPEGAPENNMGWSDPNFSHSFSVPGSYTITLNAYYDFSFMGEMSTVQETISVN